MNEKFKLKPEARQFFSKDIAESIKPIEFWKERGIHINLLDAVDSVYIEYGIKYDKNSTRLATWQSNKGNPKAVFFFTVHVNEISAREYRKFSIPKMMDEMQKVVNTFVEKSLDF